jgi:hypothetical protein
MGMSHQTLMMGAEMILKMLVIFNQLTQLMAQEDFINFSHRESFRSYFTKLVCSTAVSNSALAMQLRLVCKNEKSEIQCLFLFTSVC